MYSQCFRGETPSFVSGLSLICQEDNDQIPAGAGFAGNLRFSRRRALGGGFAVADEDARIGWQIIGEDVGGEGGHVGVGGAGRGGAEFVDGVGAGGDAVTDHADGVGGGDIVGAVTDEACLFRRGAEALEGGTGELGLGLAPRRVKDTEDEVEMRGEADGLEDGAGVSALFVGEDGGGDALGMESADERGYAWQDRDLGVPDFFEVRTEDAHGFVDVLLRNEFAEGDGDGTAHAGLHFFEADGGQAEPRESVAVAAVDDAEVIDERAVEIEDDGLGLMEVHGSMSRMGFPPRASSLCSMAMPRGGQAGFSVDAAGARGHRVVLSGVWTLEAGLPPVSRVVDALRAEGAARACVDSAAVDRYDSALPAFLFELAAAGKRGGIEITEDGLPGDVTRMLSIARSVPARGDAKRPGPSGVVEHFGYAIVGFLRSAADLLRFFGRGITATGELVTGRSAMRLRDFTDVFVGVTVAALPIVSLISLLVGLIIAFLGAVVLRQFAAEFAVAYLVGYGMLREMGAVMTGVIMAGRTGAGFAAEIGSMRVNEEIDALETFGIRPYGFLVLPRVIALSIAMPLLTVYANAVGIFGGYLVSEFMIGIPAPIFFEEMVRVVGPNDFWLGVFKGYVFGIVVALSGCLRGLQCGSGAGAVGVAATRAVVLGITLIIVCNAIIDWAAATLGI